MKSLQGKPFLLNSKICNTLISTCCNKIYCLNPRSNKTFWICFNKIYCLNPRSNKTFWICMFAKALSLGDNLSNTGTKLLQKSIFSFSSLIICILHHCIGLVLHIFHHHQKLTINCSNILHYSPCQSGYSSSLTLMVVGSK